MSSRVASIHDGVGASLEAPSNPLNHLMRLPRDVRTKIFELILVHGRMIILNRPPRFTIGILRVNKAIYGETWPILYGCNTFDLGTHSTKSISKFLGRIGRRNANTIRHLSITFPNSLLVGPGDANLDEEKQHLFAAIGSQCMSVRSLKTRLVSNNFADLRLDIPDHARSVTETFRLAKAWFDAVPSCDRLAVRIKKDARNYNSESLPKCSIEALPDDSAPELRVHIHVVRQPNVTFVFEELDQQQWLGEGATDELRGTRLSLRIHVSSEVLIKSAVFRSMLLNNMTAESIQFLRQGKVDIKLPEDEPAHVLVVMQIMHETMRDIPSDWDAASLSGIASVADKYDVKAFVLRSVTKWLEHHAASSAVDIGTHFLDWTWISWFFESKEVFAVSTAAAVLYSRARIRTDDSDLPLPDHVIDGIQAKRLDAIRRIHAQLIAEKAEVHPRNSVRGKDFPLAKALSSTQLDVASFQNLWLSQAFKLGLVEYGLHHLGLQRDEYENDADYDGLSLDEMFQTVRSMREVDDWRLFHLSKAARGYDSINIQAVGSVYHPLLGYAFANMVRNTLQGPTDIIMPLLGVIESLEKDGFGLCLSELRKKREG